MPNRRILQGELQSTRLLDIGDAATTADRVALLMYREVAKLCCERVLALSRCYRCQWDHLQDVYANAC